MIALRDEFLLVAQEGGQFIPCSVEHLTFELAGAAAQQVDPEWMRQAAAGVLHYFKEELGKSHVTVAEFTAELTAGLEGSMGAARRSGPILPFPRRRFIRTIRALSAACARAPLALPRPRRPPPHAAAPLRPSWLGGPRRSAPAGSGEPLPACSALAAART